MLHARVRLAPSLLDLVAVFRTSRHVVAAAVLAVIMAESGCFSAWGIQRPPPPPINATEPLQCTTNAAVPVIDTAIALLFGSVAVGLIVGGQSSSDSVSRSVSTSAGGILVVPTVLSAISAGWGYVSTARCRELEEAVDQCLKGDRVACGKLGSGGGPPQGPSPASVPPSSNP